MQTTKDLLMWKAALCPQRAADWDMLLPPGGSDLDAGAGLFDTVFDGRGQNSKRRCLRVTSPDKSNRMQVRKTNYTGERGTHSIRETTNADIRKAAMD